MLNTNGSKYCRIKYGFVKKERAEFGIYQAIKPDC